MKIQFTHSSTCMYVHVFTHSKNKQIHTHTHTHAQERCWHGRGREQVALLRGGCAEGRPWRIRGYAGHRPTATLMLPPRAFVLCDAALSKAEVVAATADLCTVLLRAQVSSSMLLPLTSVLIPASSVLIPASSVLIPASSVLIPASSVLIPASSVLIPA
jgi:hypothetical protein